MDQKEFQQLLGRVAKEAASLPKWTQEYFEVHYGSVTTPEKEAPPTGQTAPPTQEGSKRPADAGE